MTLEQKLEHFQCLLRHAEIFQLPLLIAFYQRRIEAIQKEIQK